MPVPIGTMARAPFRARGPAHGARAARCAASSCSCSNGPAAPTSSRWWCASAVDSPMPPRLLLDPGHACRRRRRSRSTGSSRPTTASLVAIGLSEGGTEDSVLHVLARRHRRRSTRCASTTPAPRRWRGMPDGSGFWYARYPDGDQYHRHIRFHALGTDPADDPVVFDRLPNAEAWPDVHVSPDGAHLLVEVQVGWSRTDAAPARTSHTGEWTTVGRGRRGADRRSCSPATGCSASRRSTHRTAAWSRCPSHRPRLEHWQHHRRPSVTTWCSADRRSWVIELLVVVSRAAVDSLERRALDGGCSSTHRRPGHRRRRSSSIADQRRRVGPSSWSSSFDAPTAVWRDADGTGSQRWCPDAPTPAEPSHRCTSATQSYPSLDGTEIGLFLIHRADVTPSAGHAADPERLRRLRDQRVARMDAQPGGVVRRGWRLGHRRPARWLRARRALAPGRPAGQQAERVRRLPRGRRLAGRHRAWRRHDRLRSRRRFERRPARRRSAHPTPRPGPCRVVRGAAARHGALPAVPHRPTVDRRVRRPRRRRGVRLAATRTRRTTTSSTARGIRRCCSRPPRATPASTRCTLARWRRCCSTSAVDQDERPVLLWQAGRAGSRRRQAGVDASGRGRRRAVVPVVATGSRRSMTAIAELLVRSPVAPWERDRSAGRGRLSWIGGTCVRFVDGGTGATDARQSCRLDPGRVAIQPRAIDGLVDDVRR